MFIQNQKRLQKQSEEGLFKYFLVLYPNKKAIRIKRMALSSLLNY